MNELESRSTDLESSIWEIPAQLFHDHSGAWNMSNTDEAVLNFRLGLRFPMRWGFVATTRLDIDHETEPAPGKDKTDTAFIITMGFEW